MSYDRRAILKYVAGTSAAGMLAGCGGQQAAETTPGGNGAQDTVTTLEPADPTTTESMGGNGNGNGENQTTTQDCTYSTVQPEAGSGEFLVWHGREEATGRLLQGTRDIFNQMGPTMKLTKIPSGNYLTKLRSSIPAGKGPHVFLWAHDIAGEFFDSGFVTDQGDQLRVDPCVYTDSAWQAVNYEGNTVGLPWAAESPALIYNEDVLGEIGTEPPETLSEMVDIMDQWHDPDSNQFGLGYPINPYFSSWAAQAFGEEIYNGEDDELGITSPEVSKGIRIITQELRPYMPKDPSYEAQSAVFNDGVAPFMINGPWTTTGLQERDFSFNVRPIPQPEGGQPRPYMGVKMNFFAKKMESQNQGTAAAREFSEWYTTNDRRLLNLANNGGFVPVKANLANHPQLPEIVRGYAQQVRNGYPMPQNPKMNAVWGPFGTAVTEAFNSPDKDVESLMQNAAEKIRNNWQENN